MHPVTGWADAVRAAVQLQADYPRWRVRAVLRRDGPGVAAKRDGWGVCVVVGSPAEVRAALVDAEPLARWRHETASPARGGSS